MWTLSNIISIARLVLTIPMAVSLIEHKITNVILIGVIAIVSDLLDGYFARRLKQVSESGKIIDPIADKIFVGTMGVILTLQGLIPLWFILLIIIRDVLLLSGGLYVQRKLNYVIPSILIGKIAVLFIALALLVSLLDINEIKDYIIYAASVILVYSLFIYAMRMMRILKSKSVSR